MCLTIGRTLWPPCVETVQQRETNLLTQGGGRGAGRRRGGKMRGPTHRRTHWTRAARASNYACRAWATRHKQAEHAAARKDTDANDRPSKAAAARTTARLTDSKDGAPITRRTGHADGTPTCEASCRAQPRHAANAASSRSCTIPRPMLTNEHRRGGVGWGTAVGASRGGARETLHRRR